MYFNSGLLYSCCKDDNGESLVSSQSCCTHLQLSSFRSILPAGFDQKADSKQLKVQTAEVYQVCIEEVRAATNTACMNSHGRGARVWACETGDVWMKSGSGPNPQLCLSLPKPGFSTLKSRNYFDSNPTQSCILLLRTRPTPYQDSLRLAFPGSPACPSFSPGWTETEKRRCSEQGKWTATFCSHPGRIVKCLFQSKDMKTHHRRAESSKRLIKAANVILWRLSCRTHNINVC